MQQLNFNEFINFQTVWVLFDYTDNLIGMALKQR